MTHAVLTCGDPPAASEGVSSISLLTPTDGVVVDDLTLGEGSTGSRTGVTTLLTDTGEVTGTLAVEDTLWSTVWRHSHISRQTGAGGDVVLVPALRERSAGVWQAGVDWFWPAGGDWD